MRGRFRLLGRQEMRRKGFDQGTSGSSTRNGGCPYYGYKTGLHATCYDVRLREWMSRGRLWDAYHAHGRERSDTRKREDNGCVFDMGDGGGLVVGVAQFVAKGPKGSFVLLMGHVSRRVEEGFRCPCRKWIIQFISNNTSTGTRSHLSNMQLYSRSVL